MADAEQLLVLGQGLEAWNAWRRRHPAAPIDLSAADLRHLEFGLLPALQRAAAQGLDLAGASWTFVLNEIVGSEVMPLDLRAADLRGARLDGVDLRKADCRGSDFSGASVKDAELGGADLSSARFVGSDLRGARLRGADLSESTLVRTGVEGADFGHATVYGSSVWDLAGVPGDETNLLITPPGGPSLRTDGLALAQLLHFLMRNEQASDVIDAVASRTVLVLGNFKETRKAVLEAVRGALKRIGFLPMIFDFTGPASKDTTGTVETLARLAGFVVADLTDPSSVPHELATTVPFLRTTPVVLLRETGATGYSMASDLQAYPWVLGVHHYATSELLDAQLPDLVGQARGLADQLRGKRSRR